MMNKQEKILNKEQLEAIQHGKGPLLIIAGAGTGKTTVVTERIKWFISQELAKPSEVLALTFTDKAAREMEERVDQVMPYGYTQMWILTFHSFCDRVLRDEAIHIGLDPGFFLMTEAEATQFLKNHIFKLQLSYFRPLGNPTKFITGLKQHFSRLQDEDITPNEYLRWAENQKSKILPVKKSGKSQKQKPKLKIDKTEIEKTLELAKAYQAYAELKVKEGVMDFADLISNTLKLFRQRPNILREYQKKFKYILVDEFQDTNIAQNELAILLAGTKQKITVCADDDQAIYRWRGAAISNVIQFRKRFPKAKIVVLTKNYRSTQKILDKAYKLIQKNNPDRLEVKEKINKKLKAMRKIEGEETEFIYTDRVEDEAEEVAKKITKLTSTSGSRPGLSLSRPGLKYDYKDFAILVRANNHADAFVRALSRAGIPYQFLGPGMLFRKGEIKDLIAYLKVLYNFEDSVAMYRLFSMDDFDISARDLAAINNLAKKFNLSLFEAAEITAANFNNSGKQEKYEKYRKYLPFVSQKTKETLFKIVKMIHRHLKLVPKETAGQILYYFLEDSGFLKKLTDYKTVKEEKMAGNISRFFDKLKTYETEHEDASVFAVCDWIDLSMELGESPLAADYDWSQENAVNILTVHSAKGLEFPIVFLVNLVSARFPSISRREQIPIPEDLIKEELPEGDYHLEEERRLFYVGMTRACDKLLLTAANFYGAGKREKKLSPFIYEVLGNQPFNKIKDKEAEIGQLSLLEWKKPEKKIEEKIFRPINYLSYSQIQTFDTCPLQYRYRYIQKIPVPPSAAASFGSSIHQALYKFYQKAKQGEKLQKTDLLQLLEKKWSSIGYFSKTHEERYKKQGKKMLSEFFDKAFDPKNLPRDLEQMFIIKITPHFKIGGKIDRTDRLENGRLEIIDYKTGRVSTEKEIEKSLQMTVYALAAADPGIYGKKPEDVILSFYFLEPQEKISTKRTKEQLQKAREELLEKKKEIEKSDFQPTPGVWCDFCDFKLICEAWN